MGTRTDAARHRFASSQRSLCRRFARAGSTTPQQSFRKDVIASHANLNDSTGLILDELKAVAQEVGTPAAQVALAWVRSKGAVTSILLGARTSQQLEDNLGVLETTLSTDQLARLDARSAIELGFPHDLLAAPMNQLA